MIKTNITEQPYQSYLCFSFGFNWLTMKLKWKLAWGSLGIFRYVLLFFFQWVGSRWFAAWLQLMHYFLPSRHGVASRARDRRCMSWWRGSGRHLRSTGRPAPSAVKATSTCRKNVNEKKTNTLASIDCQICWSISRSSVHPPSFQLVINMISFSLERKRTTSVWPCRSWSGTDAWARVN